VRLREIKKKYTQPPLFMTEKIKKKSHSFAYLNLAQFLGALNDNIFKLLIAYFCIEIMGDENSTKMLALAGAIFVIPFLLFSSTSGTLADRYSKRNIIVFCKVLEVLIMSLGLIAFSMRSPIGAYVILFLMATQSAIFGPSKYGIIPELVKIENISSANGLLTSLTFLAIIVGTFLASFIVDITERNFIFASVFCTIIAIIGMFASFKIAYTQPSGSTKKFNPFFLNEIYKTTKLIGTFPSLLIAVMGSAYFLFAGAFIQLNIIPFGMQSLHLTDVQGGYLFLLTALGIGAGSIIAGKASGKVVELGLVPIGGVGMTIGCFLLDLWSAHLYLIIPLVVILGMFGGLFLIPLDAYIQVASPHKKRGQIVATTNFIGFFGVLCASFIIYFISEVLGIEADKGFTFLGYLTALITIAITALFYDYLARYLATGYAKLHYKIAIEGEEYLSTQHPSLFFCKHSSCSDILLLLGAQRSRVRFFKEESADVPKWTQRFYTMLKTVDVRSMELINDNEAKMYHICKSLEKGISVCLFVNDKHSDGELSKMEEAFHRFLDTKHPIIDVKIQTGVKLEQTNFITRLLKKCRVPANISFKKKHLNSDMPKAICSIDL
jgi:acyl-[acyl-carrier-protein]-phospholipid O-acyltransferase/long-chain-fatty-acid--[acyl-carrier-protein] ligase